MKKYHLWGLILAVVCLAVVPAFAQEETMPTFVPIGAGYPDTYPGFLEAALPYVEANEFERFYILMMPMAFSYQVEELPANELLDNSLAIERRRRQLENACADIAPDIPCEVVVPPLWTRAAALDELALDYFTDDLGAVYFVGGDQTIAMQILADSPVEAALADAYARGVVMGGNSAGLAIQSRTMIGGYIGDFGPETGLAEGAVDIWNETEGVDGAPPRRGLSFGLTDIIVEQHFWERARISRLLNALAQPETPNLGVGVDSYSGAVIRTDESGGVTVADVFGLYGAVVLDAETFGAADAATFQNGVLSIRDVLVHLLASGDYAYDLTARQALSAEAPARVEMTYNIAAPDGAGSLALWSGLAAGIAAGDVSIESAPPHLVIITGYADAESAQAVADAYVDVPDTTVLMLADGDELPSLSDFGTVTIHAHDVTLIAVAALAPVKDFWLNGGSLVLDDGAALLAGVAYANEPPVPYDSDDDLLIEDALQGALIDGMVEIANGWALIDANVEVDVMDDNRFARLFALEYNVPVGTLGLSAGTMVAVSTNGAFVSPPSGNGVYALSFANADLMVGDDDGLVVINGILDVFAPGEDIE
ncbi:MAG: hypothetical protein SGI73_05960 [Chloroflexota bacterium]|nr:hypothetical protein [Chloroflexota bacterium]